MHQFDYNNVQDSFVTSEIMNLVAVVHEHRGRQQLYLTAKKDILDSMTEVAKVQSTAASNRIEGIRTSDARLQKIMNDKTNLISRDEEEIVGYRDVLNTVHENYEFIDISTNLILQLHRNLYRHTSSSMGGRFKVGDNEIRGVREDGAEYVRFKPVPAVATKDALDQLCGAFRQAIMQEKMDPLLASLLFVFDFTCIHPFNDGNGRMSRLLTLLLLYKAGYMVGKYISLEKEIERTKTSYYEALSASSDGWHENTNDPNAFIRYMLGVIISAYQDFESRVPVIESAKLTKSERIENLLQVNIEKLSKADILSICPDISSTTVERTLAELLKAGKIKKIGAGRSTAYIWDSSHERDAP